MPLFPILPFVLLAAVIIALITGSSKKRIGENIDEFFKREKNAKTVPAMDLGTIAYLNIPIEKFYMGNINDENIQNLESQIIALSKKPLLNLTGKTNTELRETYGSPNFEAMKAIGDDFDRLTMILVDYADALINKGHITEAITVLEYGAYIKSDISKNYTLLCDCFITLNQKNRILTLKEYVLSLNIPMESVIINYMDKLLE